MTDREAIDVALNRVFKENCVDHKQDGGCIIHFPEIRITNENGSIHDIQDLFVALHWDYNSLGNIDTFGSTIRGLRTTFSPSELHMGYRHSHLSEMYIDNWNAEEDPETDEDGNPYPPHMDLDWGDFCIGDDDLSTTLGALNMAFNIDKFQTLLHIVDDFVRWESLDGGPHIEMEGISDVESEITETHIPNITRLDNLYNEFRYLATEDLPAFMISLDPNYLEGTTFFHDSLDTTLTLGDALDDYLNHYIRTHPRVANKPRHGNFYLIEYKGKYYVENHSYREIRRLAEEINQQDRVIMFKGNWIYSKILPMNTATGSEVIANGTKIPHPHIKMAYKIAIQKALHPYLIQKANV